MANQIVVLAIFKDEAAADTAAETVGSTTTASSSSVSPRRRKRTLLGDSPGDGLACPEAAAHPGRPGSLRKLDSCEWIAT
jgi:hypothetical protein